MPDDVTDRPAMLSDLERVATKDDVRAEIKAALEAALEPYATKDDVRAEIKAALEPYATKEDLRVELERFATKEDLRTELEAALFATRAEINEDIARHSKAALDEFRTWFAALNDNQRAVEAEVATQRRDLDDHRADTTVHRVAPRARRR